MKKIIIILLLFIGLSSYSQDKGKETIVNKKYVAWVSPSNATHIYGVTFTYFYNEGIINHPVKRYGIDLDINPLGLIMSGMILFHAPFPDSHDTLFPNYNKTKNMYNVINGIHIGSLSIDDSIINGIDINIGGSMSSITNGITISGVMNKHYIINGLTFGTLGNHDVTCRGVQIGLFNSCDSLKGIQIGLWNRNQKRSFPIINWSF